jgi:hypothetical protein
MRFRVLALVLPLAVAACDGVTDPVAHSGLRIENRTRDSLLVTVVALDPRVLVLAGPPDDSRAPARVDTAFLRFAPEQPLGNNRLLPPGTSLTFLPEAMSLYGSDYNLAVLIARIRDSYIISTNGAHVRRSDLDRGQLTLTLRDGRFFPNILSE